jgi:F-type H+-transporting ATPase subunit b
MLDISPILLISIAIVFLLVLARLNSCLYKPLFKHMDERDTQIKSDLDNARNNSADVDGMLEEASHVIAAAKQEAAAIREKARLEATEVAQSKLSEAKNKADQKYNDFVKVLADEKQSLEQSLVASMPQFKEALNAKLKMI